MTPTTWLGWMSSLVLVLTIGRQVWRQWRSGTSEGVSQWLFVGQIVASTGFTAYSALLGNAVFTVTNAVLLVAAILGLTIVKVHRRRERRRTFARPEVRRTVLRAVRSPG